MKARLNFLRLIPAKQVIAVLLSLCLVESSGDLVQAAKAVQTPARSEAPLWRELSPPRDLGRVTDSYLSRPESCVLSHESNTATLARDAGPKTQDSRLVVLIQDLHAHYGVQKNIAGILEFLTKRLPFKVAVEGASGPIDTSVMALFPDQKIKQEALDYLMREGELTGMEYFAAMRGIPNLLVGVEDRRYYTIHRELFRKTLEQRSQLVQRLRGMQAEIESLRPQVYSRKLKKLQKKLDGFERGEPPLDQWIGYLVSQARTHKIDLTREFPTLTMVLTHGPAAQTLNMERLLHEAQELAFEIKLRLARSAHSLSTSSPLAGEEALTADLVQVEHDLDLLLRVAGLRATEPEVRAFAPRLNQFVALTTALLKNNSSPLVGEGRVRGNSQPQSPSPQSSPIKGEEDQLRQLISSSLDYYVMAFMRNRPMVERTLALLNHPEPNSRNHPEPVEAGKPERILRHAQDDLKAIVLIAGGFHTVSITQLLRERGVSYVVITPTIDHYTEADRQLYVKRLNGTYLTKEEIQAAARTQALTDARASATQNPSPATLAVGAFVAAVTAFTIYTHTRKMPLAAMSGIAAGTAAGIAVGQKSIDSGPKVATLPETYEFGKKQGWTKSQTERYASLLEETGVVVGPSVGKVAKEFFAVITSQWLNLKANLLLYLGPSQLVPAFATASTPRAVEESEKPDDQKAGGEQIPAHRLLLSFLKPLQLLAISRTPVQFRLPELDPHMPDAERIKFIEEHAKLSIEDLLKELKRELPETAQGMNPAKEEILPLQQGARDEVRLKVPLTHPSTYAAGKIWVRYALPFVYRLRGLRVTLPEKDSAEELYWIQEHFAPPFEAVFLAFWAERFERAHGAVWEDKDGTLTMGRKKKALEIQEVTHIEFRASFYAATDILLPSFGGSSSSGYLGK